MDVALSIYSILTKRKYNRSRIPLEKGVMDSIRKSVSADSSVQLVGFWGAGQKTHYGAADEKSCLFFAKLNEEIKTVYAQGIEFTFIFATKHAEHNGYDKSGVASYMQSMVELFDKNSFKYVFLDNLWDKYGLSFEKIDSVFSTKAYGWWDATPDAELIEKAAESRNKKYDAVTAAQKYYIMRDIEKELLKTEFDGYIFHAFVDPTMKHVLPCMPTLYFWGTEKWKSDAPWFMD